MELSCYDSIEMDSSFIIKEEDDKYIFTGKVLKEGLLICCCADYENYRYEGINVDEMISDISEQVKNKILKCYIEVKRYDNGTIEGYELLEKLIGIKKNDVVCDICDWHGPEEDRLKQCPVQEIPCQYYWICKTRIKRNKMAKHKEECETNVYKCVNKGCEKEGVPKDMEIHRKECENRIVNCKDCTWCGKYINRYHKCIYNRLPWESEEDYKLKIRVG